MNVSVTSPELRDLAALLALPRMWRDRNAAFIGKSVLDVLVSLLRSDVAYLRLSCARDHTVLESAWPAQKQSSGDLGKLLGASADAGPAASVSVVSNPVGSGSVRVLRISARLDDQEAMVALGSRRADFPTDVESFLARVAVEQAMLAVHASRLVASLTTANAAKATFLATMSHELRTPLNAVIGYSELLLARIGGELSEQQELHVGRIESAARHLLGLIEGILSFARLEAGKEQVNLADVDSVEITGEVAALIEPLAQAKGLQIKLNLGAPAHLRTDHSKVRQILLNLLSNAVKFTRQGHVALEMSADSEHVTWRVSDTGIGISSTDIERIFEPFHQGAQPSAGRAAGTGLGLTVSRQLARLLGGDVTAHATVGAGSTFVFRLPLDGRS